MELSSSTRMKMKRNHSKDKITFPVFDVDKEDRDLFPDNNEKDLDNKVLNNTKDLSTFGDRLLNIVKTEILNCIAFGRLSLVKIRKASY